MCFLIVHIEERKSGSQPTQSGKKKKTICSVFQKSGVNLTPIEKEAYLSSFDGGKLVVTKGDEYIYCT